MALLGDPIYCCFSKRFRGQPSLVVLTPDSPKSCKFYRVVTSDVLCLALAKMAPRGNRGGSKIMALFCGLGSFCWGMLRFIGAPYRGSAVRLRFQGSEGLI